MGDGELVVGENLVQEKTIKRFDATCSRADRPSASALARHSRNKPRVQQGKQSLQGRENPHQTICLCSHVLDIQRNHDDANQCYIELACVIAEDITSK